MTFDVREPLDLSLEAPLLRRLHAYWDERRGGRRFPARSDIDPLDFAWVLGRVMLVDVLRTPDLAFRYRLVGTAIVQRHGFDMTGRTLDEFPNPEHRRVIETVYREAVAHAAPMAERHDVKVDGRRLLYEALILPLGTPEGTVEMLMICVVDLDA